MLVLDWALRIDNPAEQGPTGKDREQDYRSGLGPAYHPSTRVPSRLSCIRSTPG